MFGKIVCEVTRCAIGMDATCSRKLKLALADFRTPSVKPASESNCMYSTTSRTSVGNRLLFASLSQAKKRLKNLTLVLRVAVRRLPAKVKVG